MPKTADPRQVLAAKVKARREELGMTQTQLAANGGPSTASIRAVEAARAPSITGRTIRALETALGWEAGSVQDVLLGNEPTMALSPALPDDELVTSLTELRERLASIDRMLVAKTKSIAEASVVSLRLDADVWDLVKRTAATERRTVNAIVRDAVVLYSDVMGEAGGGGGA
jgi:DNA-binding XRE family transcriptional regulator/uncharacterized protein (DUF4415 family)